jgi:hypothetical protein
MAMIILLIPTIVRGPEKIAGEQTCGKKRLHSPHAAHACKYSDL